MRRKIFFILILLLCGINIFAQGVVTPPRTCTMCKVTKAASEFAGGSKTCRACAKKKPETRTCSNCRKSKSLIDFSGNSKICKECVGKVSERSYQIGNDYFNGRNGKTKNYSEAVKCYQKAADMGHAEAMVSLAECYENGYGVVKNESIMVMYEKKAAALGNAKAQYLLGNTYYLGSGGEPQNYSEAIKWYKKSAEQGNSNAQNSLGSLYMLGLFVEENYLEAIKWYRKAAEQEDVLGLYYLGFMYEKGFGVTRDFSQAKYWYEKSAAKGGEDAKNGLRRITCREQVKENLRTGKCVDLGLPSGTLWATYNVGASKPEDYGDYFAWGEVRGHKSGKSVFSWKTYKWCNGTKEKLTKYNTESKYGLVDNKNELDLEDDAANTNWGSAWRIPDTEQFAELREECSWTWTTYKGVKGYSVKGKNGNSIFLPAAGLFNEASIKSVGFYGYYWSNSLQSSISTDSQGLIFYANSVSWSVNERYYGRSIRPVASEKKKWL